MNERVKKILIVVLFIGSVIGIAAALYFVFFKPQTTAPPATVGNEQPGGVGSLPNAGSGGARPPGGTTGGGTGGTGTGTGQLPSPVANGGKTQTVVLTTGAVADIAVNGNNMNFYDPHDGKFYTIDAAGNIVALSDKTFPKASDVAWNGDANKAVIEFPDGSNVVYDFDTETQNTLPSHWEDFEFSPTSDEIEAKSMVLDPNGRSLVVSNADGSNVKSVQALGENADQVEIAWSPNDQVIAFADTADPLSGGLDRKMILPIGQNSENFKGLIVEGLDFTPLWSPDGKQLLYSVVGDYSDNKPLLWLVDATSGTMGENRHSLGINTWADKCTFATATSVYCAVPQGLTANMGLQRALAANLPDYLYHLDLATGQTSLLAVPATSTTMNSLSVSSDESAAYYTNGTTGKLETIRLK